MTRRAALLAATLLATVVVIGGGDGAVARRALPVDATYRGKGTQLTTAPDGNSVHIDKIPAFPKCSPRRPSGLGQDLGPFALAANGTFSNKQTRRGLSDGEVAIAGRFASDGSTVSGTIVGAAFEDPAKGFHCKAFKRRFSATHVSGTGGTPGTVLATDVFANRKSGFAVFNTQNTYSQYLKNRRFRVGLRGGGIAVALRKQPVASVVEVSATVRWFGTDMNDTFGVVCGATDATSYNAGLIRMDGQAILARYVNGQLFERSDPIALPAGLLTTRRGDGNVITLTCIPDPPNNVTHLALTLNGQLVLRARNSTVSRGKTGVFAAGTAGGTDFDYESYSVAIPEQLATS